MKPLMVKVNMMLFVVELEELTSFLSTFRAEVLHREGQLGSNGRSEVDFRSGGHGSGQELVVRSGGI